MRWHTMSGEQSGKLGSSASWTKTKWARDRSLYENKLLVNPRDLLWLWQSTAGDVMQCVCKGNGATGPR